MSVLFLNLDCSESIWPEGRIRLVFSILHYSPLENRLAAISSSQT